MEWTKFLIRTALVLTISVLAIQVYYIYQLQNDFAVARESISVAPSAANETRANQTNDEAEDPAPDEQAKANQTDDEIEEPSQAVFLHKATFENISGNSTHLDHPLTNGNPNAVVSVTHSWNPGGGPGVYNDHNIGVWYDAGVRKWAIYNEDRAAMPQNVCFNVAVLKSPTEAE